MNICVHGQNFEFCALCNPSASMPDWKTAFPDRSPEKTADMKIKLRAASVRVRAKAFANRLRSERWAESIPEEDIDFCTDEELQEYMCVLRAKSCVQRTSDSKWEAL